eukprot:1000475-Pleurochrysis_carterae.AAC.1
MTERKGTVGCGGGREEGPGRGAAETEEDNVLTESREERNAKKATTDAWPGGEGREEEEREQRKVTNRKGSAGGRVNEIDTRDACAKGEVDGGKVYMKRAASKKEEEGANTKARAWICRGILWV